MLWYVHARRTRNIIVVCVHVHNRPASACARGKAWHTYNISAADVIQTRAKQWGVLYTDGEVHASFEDKSNWLRSNAVTAG